MVRCVRSSSSRVVVLFDESEKIFTCGIAHVRNNMPPVRRAGFVTRPAPGVPKCRSRSLLPLVLLVHTTTALSVSHSHARGEEHVPTRLSDVRPSPRRRARGRRPRLVQPAAGRAPGVRRAVPARPLQAVPQIAPSVGRRGRSAGVLRRVHRQSHEPHVQALLQGTSRDAGVIARRAASA